MNNFAPGTENYGLPEKLVYFFVSQLIKMADILRERQS